VYNFAATEAALKGNTAIAEQYDEPNEHGVLFKKWRLPTTNYPYDNVPNGANTPVVPAFHVVHAPQPNGQGVFAGALNTVQGAPTIGMHFAGLLHTSGQIATSAPLSSNVKVDRPPTTAVMKYDYFRGEVFDALCNFKTKGLDRLFDANIANVSPEITTNELAGVTLFPPIPSPVVPYNQRKIQYMADNFNVRVLSHVTDTTSNSIEVTVSDYAAATKGSNVSVVCIEKFTRNAAGPNTLNDVYVAVKVRVPRFPFRGDNVYPPSVLYTYDPQSGLARPGGLRSYYDIADVQRYPQFSALADPKYMKEYMSIKRRDAFSANKEREELGLNYYN